MTTVDSVDGDRLARLELPEAYVAALNGLLATTLEESFSLPSKIRNFGLALAYGNKGALSRSKEHGELALSEGLTRDEALEGLLAGVLSRGFGMLWDNLWIAEQAADAGIPGAQPVERTETAGILEYMRQTFGSVPQWQELLAGTSPQTFEAYYQLRAAVFRDAALPRRYKELLLVIINCTERYDVGMDVHMNGALTAGASREELLDAVRTSIASGGMVAWLSASEIAQRALERAGR